MGGFFEEESAQVGEMIPKCNRDLMNIRLFAPVSHLLQPTIEMQCRLAKPNTSKPLPPFPPYR